MLRKLKFLALAAAFGAQCSIAEEWIFDPLGWRYSDSELVTSGSGFALSQKGSAVRLAVAGEFIPESCQDGGWSTLGVGVFSGENDFWKLSLVRGPDSSNPVHTFELGEMRNGEWMSQIRLPCSLNRISGKWEFGEKYRLKLELSPQGIEGSVRKCEDGVELFRCRYEFPANSDAVRSGCGALHASGGFRARMLRGGVRIQEPSVEREPVFPPYSSAVARAPFAGKATGFFRVEKKGGRWWAVDPNGKPLVLAGVDHVRWDGIPCEKLGYAPYGRGNEGRYASKEEWAERTVSRLKSWGFNLLGAGCDVGRLGYRGLAHTVFLSMGERLCSAGDEWEIAPSLRAPGTSFPNVFHPDFAAACDWVARERCKPNVRDPWLLGYFIDNELAWWGRNWGGVSPSGLFRLVKAKPAHHTAKIALEAYIAKTLPGGWKEYDCLTGAKRELVDRGFLAIIADKYFSATTKAIRRYDPNHLILGCRFAGTEGMDEAVWRAAAKYCDVVSFNFYPWVDLDRGVVYDRNGGEMLPEYLSSHYSWVNGPMMITEWSFPALDTGRACRIGAGQRFRTQRERAKASQICARTFLSLPYIVGYDYFMWVDEPALGLASSFPEDCNYGLVNESDEPYALLTDMFARIHRDSAGLHMASPPKPKAVREISDRDRFMLSLKKKESGDFVRFERDGANWTVKNSAGLVLSGSVGGKPVDKVSVDGVEYGSVSALLETYSCGELAWHETHSTVDIGFEDKGNYGVVTLRSLAGHGDCVEMVLKLTVATSRCDFHSEIAEVRNNSDRVLDVNRLYLRTFANFRNPASESKTFDEWKGFKNVFWHSVDGLRFGLETSDVSAEEFQFWLDPAGVQHPDARFRPTKKMKSMVLSPGRKYIPERPVGAHIAAFRQN